jgi:hypothetical protein
MSKRAATTSFSPLLILGLFLGWGSLVGAAQAGPAAAAPPSRSLSCNPSLAIVSPEFVVISNAPQPFLLTMVARCLDAGDQIFLTNRGTSIKVNLNPPSKTVEEEQTVHGNVQLPAGGDYELCVTNAAAIDCTNPIGSGPTLSAIASTACSGQAIPESLANLRSDLRSEARVRDQSPPRAPGQCERRPARADKAIIVNAETGLTCTADDPAKPNEECTGGKKEKKPLHLRAGDTARLYIVAKNPFLQNYTFTSSDSQIKDDDIGTFLGLLVPGINGGGQKSSSGGGNAAAGVVSAAVNRTATASEKLQEKYFVRISPLEAANRVTDAIHDVQGAQDAAEIALREQVTSDMTSAQADLKISKSAGADIREKEAQIREKAKPSKGQKGQAPDPADIERLTGLLNQRTDALRSASYALDEAIARANEVNACVTVLTGRVDNLVRNYSFFAQEYNSERNSLLSGVPRCEDLSNTAIVLWKLIAAEQAKIVDSRIDINLRDAMAAANSALANTQSPDPTKHEAPSKNRGILTADVKSLTGAFCTLKAMRKEIAPVLNANAAAIESVLINPNAFHSEILIGPYADATQVEWTLQKSMTQSPIKPVDSASFNAALDDCLSKSDESAPGPKQKSGAPPGDNSTSKIRQRTEMPARGAALIDAAFSFMPANNDDGAQQSQSKPKTESKTGNEQNPQPQGEQPKDSSTTTRGRRINFGSERFIVSAGLTGSPLGLREFGKGVGQAFDASGNPIPGQETANIITLKTDQSYRLSPMVFLNSRIYQWNGHAEALYATLGITAKSDSNGVAPEYLIGLSQSLLQRHLLLTAGAYAGRQQKLTGGLFVNEAIPSNLTGDIPSQSNYQMNVGFSISWRIPGLAK